MILRITTLVIIIPLIMNHHDMNILFLMWCHRHTTQTTILLIRVYFDSIVSIIIVIRFSTMLDTRFINFHRFFRIIHKFFNFHSHSSYFISLCCVHCLSALPVIETSHVFTITAIQSNINVTIWENIDFRFMADDCQVITIERINKTINEGNHNGGT